jgi:hypothetical protein
VVLALAAAFFAWVTAEPVLVAIGHAQSGTATVATCAGSGIQRRCHASFEDDSGRLLAVRVPLVGTRSGEAIPGATVPARMVGDGGRAAYPARSELRAVWATGITMLLLCGLALIWAGGATRLPSRRCRTIGVLVSLVAPLALFLGMLVAAW